MSADEFGKIIKTELKKWREIAEKADIKAQ
jgi:hypothetical protein